ncbi:MAG TPA: hypothetical protein VK914_03760 [bacterium]|jgi:hypothetical protein|nr:hypothetical protein [bacterium]
MAGRNARGRPDPDAEEPSEAPQGVEFVDLEKLEPDDDASELSGRESEEPGRDSPGDDAVLDQEELYLGISSESMPSSRIKGPLGTEKESSARD